MAAVKAVATSQPERLRILQELVTFCSLPHPVVFVAWRRGRQGIRALTHIQVGPSVHPHIEHVLSIVPLGTIVPPRIALIDALLLQFLALILL